MRQVEEVSVDTILYYHHHWICKCAVAINSIAWTYHIISDKGWNISHAANVLWAKMVFFFLLNLLVCYLQKNYFLEVCWLHEYLIGFVITIVFLTKFYPILIEVLLLVAQKVFSPSFLYVIGSQCSAGTVSVCLTCSTLSLWWPVWQWKGQLCPHSISVIRVRGNMTICSWITKLHWLVIFLWFWAELLDGCLLLTLLQSLVLVLPRHKHFKPVKLPRIKIRMEARHNQLNQIPFPIPMLI